MRYLPHTEAEIASMLATIGVSSIDELFRPIPAEDRLGRPLRVEPALDEMSLQRHLEGLADRNTAQRMVSFLGAGTYAHHVPPAVDQLLMRGEFLTAYTPYQPEVAQGTLQAIFEFQTIVSEILGLPIANASMYDGASATAEAVLMARRVTKRTRVLLSAGLHPEYTQTVLTYLRGLEAEGPPSFSTVPLGADGRTDLEALSAALAGNDVACVVVGEPNFFGVLEDIDAIADRAHRASALLVTASPEPVAFSIVRSPGERGADIAVGEGQPLGLPPQYGGPGVGLLTCREGREYLTNVPGRLVGETVDQRGTRGYVLTLSTREQHIRRERATSNICTNHSLCALAVTIRMCLLGRRGFVEVGKHCHAKAEYLKARIGALAGYELPFSAPTFNEFAVRRRAGKVRPVLDAMTAVGVLGGVDLGSFDPALDSTMLISVTERHSREDLDQLVSLLEQHSKA